MLKKWGKRLLVFILILVVFGALTDSSDKSNNGAQKKSSSTTQSSSSTNPNSEVVPAEEAISRLFADLPSEQNKPQGAEPDILTLLERVRDSDGDLKTEDGFKIRVPHSNETKVVDDLVFTGTTPGGLKLYVSSDSRSIKIDESNAGMVFLAFCPELNQGMEWTVKSDIDMETFATTNSVMVTIEDQNVTFTTKPGDKIYEFLQCVPCVTDVGKKTMETMSKIKDFSK